MACALISVIHRQGARLIIVERASDTYVDILNKTFYTIAGLQYYYTTIITLCYGNPSHTPL